MLREDGSLGMFDTDLIELKKIIRNNLIDTDATVKILLNDLAADDGKLIRGVFTLIGGSFGKIEKEKLINISAGVELLHLATLVHDDIIDEANIRRGKKTIHSKHGVKTGIFTGDYLFSQAYVIFSKNCSHKSIIDVSETIKSICRGEINQFYSLYSLDSTIKSYLKRVSSKCASLFSLSLSMGAYESNANIDIVKKLKSIGYSTGMAFQLIDDLLDITSSERILGKPSGNDIKEGIYTMAVLYELRRGNTHLRNYLKEGNFNEALNLLKNSAGLKKTRETAQRYTNRALILANELPNTDESQALKRIIAKMLLRDY